MSTVTLPGIGKVDQRYAIAGGAVIAGIVGYAWFTRGTASSEDEQILGYDSDGNAIYAGEGYDALGFPLQPGSTPDYVPPTIVDSNVDVNETTGYTTNAQWTQGAVSILGTYGRSAGAVSSALGKYLQRRPLTPAEIDHVQAAIAVAGPPPVGGPYQIIEEQAGAATGPPAVTGLTASPGPTSIRLSWNASSGAAGWEVRREGGGTARRSTPAHVSSDLRPGTEYTFTVRAYNTANQFGEPATIKARTTGSTSLGTPRAGATSVQRTAVTIKWDPVPGATHYYLTREGGGRGVRIRGRSHTSRQLRPGTTYRFHIRAAKASGSAEVTGPAAHLTVTTRR